MKNKEQFNSIELKLIEEFESFGNSEVGAFYISSVTDSETFSTKAELMEAITATLVEWYKDVDPIDLVNGETLQSVGDYLPLFLALPNDTTVLAVGNGAVAAPNTITAHLQESYDGFKVLAVYDYEENEEAVKADLEELFPSTPPQWLIVFRYDNKDYDYPIIIGAEDRTEALTKALPIFNNECDWHYMPWKSVDIKPMDEETAEPETAEYKPPYFEEPKTECFYTGGGIYCTVFQLSGEMSDYYYGFGSEDENGYMCLFSHKGDRECNDDEYGFYDVVKYIDIEKNATEAEKWIYFEMAECEQNTMKSDGCFTEEYSRF